MTAQEAFSDFVPATPFRENYSNLIKAIWSDPNLESQIEENPSMITQFGFSEVPQRLTILPASGLPTPIGFDKIEDEYEANKTGNVVFYVPPAPKMDDSLLSGAMDSCCCCCCPCCCCT